jgi:hypothetical protein
MAGKISDARNGGKNLLLAMVDKSLLLEISPKSRLEETMVLSRHSFHQIRSDHQ